MDKNLIKHKIKTAITQEDADAKVILFGSRAKGTETSESDWDILVLLNKPHISFKDEQKIRHKLFDIELEAGQTIATFVYSIADWNSRFSVTPLYLNIQREGVYL